MKQTILGLSYDVFTMAQAAEALLALSAQPGGKIVITAGTEHVMMARRQPELYPIFNAADVMLADGIGVVKASRIVKKPLPERVGGIDVVTKVFPQWAERGDRLFLLGGQPGVAEKAAQTLQQQYPKLIICGTHDGYFKDDGEVLPLIAAAKPTVLFVCLGVPKQERWMAEHRDDVGDCVMLGLGGCLDIWAGTVKRAPKLFIKMNAEWLGRLLYQPSRIKRMSKLPGIYWAAWRELNKHGG